MPIILSNHICILHAKLSTILMTWLHRALRKEPENHKHGKWKFILHFLQTLPLFVFTSTRLWLLGDDNSCCKGRIIPWWFILVINNNTRWVFSKMDEGFTLVAFIYFIFLIHDETVDRCVRLCPGYCVYSGVACPIKCNACMQFFRARA